ncbi:MAG: UDP-N-acetylglucosamine 1-carboxyvinyltransferase [bacterium]
MDKYIIKGSKRLSGKVTISGSKNAALPILTAALLTDDPCIIHNVPDLMDIHTLCALLSSLGKKVVRKKDTVHIFHGKPRTFTAPYDLVKKMRASVLVMGPMLARYNKVHVSLPGGCAIGVRPIQFHVNGFKDMGCTARMKQGYIELATNGLKGRRILLDFPSVGATENLLMGAVLAQGKTIIDNAAQEPEIIDLALCLKQMGARIFGEGTRCLVVQGISKLHGIEYTVMPDRIEAGTFMVATAITRGSVSLYGAQHEHCLSLIDKLKEAGVHIEISASCIKVQAKGAVKPAQVETAPYPGFPTDMQAPWVSLMAVAKGVSVVTETVFEKRFLHVPELNRMGAKIRIRGNSILIEGVQKLSGAPIMVSDLRAGAALVLAALAADNTSEITRIYHIDRGYEDLEKKLRSLGASIRRVQA